MVAFALGIPGEWPSTPDRLGDYWASVRDATGGWAEHSCMACVGMHPYHEYAAHGNHTGLGLWAVGACLDALLAAYVSPRAVLAQGSHGGLGLRDPALEWAVEHSVLHDYLDNFLPCLDQAASDLRWGSTEFRVCLAMAVASGEGVYWRTEEQRRGWVCIMAYVLGLAHMGQPVPPRGLMSGQVDAPWAPCPGAPGFRR